MDVEALLEIITDLIPFLIWYGALIFRINEYKKRLQEKLVQMEYPLYDIIEKYRYQPINEIMNEFNIVNVAAALIIFIRCYFKIISSNKFLPLSYAIISMGYIMFSLLAFNLSKRVEWRGYDAIYFTLFSMSFTFFSILTTSGFFKKKYFGYDIPFLISILNSLILTGFMLFYRYVRAQLNALTSESK